MTEDHSILMRDIENEAINKNEWLKGHSDPLNVVTPSRLTNTSARVFTSERGGKSIRSLVLPPVDYYQRDGHISNSQRYAARKLYALWYIGGLRRDVAAIQISDVVTSFSTLNRLDAWDMYRAAVDSIQHENARIVTLSVVCWEEKANGNMQLLREGLDDLKKYFDIQDEK